MSLELVETPVVEEVAEEPTPIVEEVIEEPTETISVEDIVSGKTTAKKSVDTTPKWAKNRFDELTAKIYEKDREIRELKAQKAIPTDRPVPPLENDFMDSQEYRQARIKYEDDSEAWKFQQRKNQEYQENQDREKNENLGKFNENAKRMKVKYADFDAVINEPVFTPVMQYEIMASDFGPEIGYFLAKNPEEAFKLSGLSQIKLAKEIGKLEVKFSLATKKLISGAPPPINPIVGDDVVQKDTSKMTDNEWFKHDQQQKMKKFQAK